MQLSIGKSAFTENSYFIAAILLRSPFSQLRSDASMCYRPAYFGKGYCCLILDENNLVIMGIIA